MRTLTLSGQRRITALFAAVTGLGIACVTSASAGAQVSPPSKGEVDRALAKGPANAGGPFDIVVTGSKSGSVSGRDASFCVATMGDMKILALSLVETKWAISISGMGERPAVGLHTLTSTITKGLTADLTDKTTGPKPVDWVHSQLKSGTLTITRSDESKLIGSYDIVTTPTKGGELKAKGKFEANPTKC